MKKIIFLLSFLSLQACIGAGQNSKIEAGAYNSFPKVTGIDLEGNSRELPQAFDARSNIVIVAFKREQQKDVDTWIPTAEEIMKKNSEVNFYEVPVIYELGALKRSFINNGMRRGVPGETARKRTITVYTKREKFFKIMKMKEEKIYILLINNKGKIIWKAEGVKTKEKAKALRTLIGLRKKSH